MGYDERRLMTTRRTNRMRLSSSDLLVALAILSLVSAFFYPTLRSKAFSDRVDSTANEVETLRRAALGVLSQTGAWPTSGEPGRIPLEVSGAFPSDSLLSRDEYTLQWTLWEVVDQVEAPRRSPSFRPTQMPRPIQWGRSSCRSYERSEASWCTPAKMTSSPSFSRATDGRYPSYGTRCGPSSSQMAASPPIS